MLYELYYTRAELTQGLAQNVVDVENLFHCILTHLSPADHKEINHRVCVTFTGFTSFTILTHPKAHTSGRRAS